ncbi:MAG: hypothetical protein HQL33_04455 [Alphaproteobacteria bacterium]|nr:hypothetical protein [Alphaproteobacteria bacterium]
MDASARTPRIVIAGMADALGAAESAAAAGVPVRLESAPGAGAYLGSAWFRHLIGAAARAYPSARIDPVLDCGDAVGYALMALYDGVSAVRVGGHPQALAALNGIAARLGAKVDSGAGEAGPVLDLRHEPDPAAVCRAWLGRFVTPG